jgi:hypothetical protein
LVVDCELLVIGGQWALGMGHWAILQGQRGNGMEIKSYLKIIHDILFSLYPFPLFKKPFSPSSNSHY